MIIRCVCGCSIEWDNDDVDERVRSYDFEKDHRSCPGRPDTVRVTLPIDHPLVRDNMGFWGKSIIDMPEFKIAQAELNRKARDRVEELDPYRRFRDAIRDGKRVFRQNQAGVMELYIEAHDTLLIQYAFEDKPDVYFIEGVDIPMQPTQEWLDEHGVELTGECRQPTNLDWWVSFTRKVLHRPIAPGSFDTLAVDFKTYSARRWIVRKKAPAFDANDFRECPTCASKPGTPILCESCVHNRALIGLLKAKAKLREAGDGFDAWFESISVGSLCGMPIEDFKRSMHFAWTASREAKK